MVGDWNGNRGGASRTERGKTSGSQTTSVREFLTGAGRLENQAKWARFQRLVRPIFVRNLSYLDRIISAFSVLTRKSPRGPPLRSSNLYL